MFDALRKSLAKWIAPPRVKAPVAVSSRPKKAAKNTQAAARRPLSLQRMYAAAKVSRLTTGWGQSTTSEDTELATSLEIVRNRSRESCRDSSYAKRAKVIVQNNVVGWGIGLQAKVQTTRGDLHTRINDDIEANWQRWSEKDACHVGGSLHFCDIERMAMGQIFEAGEIFIRLHMEPFGGSRVPLSLELIEPERLAEKFQPTARLVNTKVRLGIEADQYHRPVAYWIHTLHPGELRLTAERTSEIERVSEEFILHLRLIDRWPQARSMPWMHAALRRLNDMDGLGEAEIVAARAAACYMGFIQSPEAETQYGDTQEDGSKIAELEPAMVEHLAPGETFTSHNPNRPNAQLDPFMRMMLREVAAGVGASYESLSRDYSQSNYSSSRLSLLDDRDLWRTLQMWFIRSFRMPLYRIWLKQAIFAHAITTIPVESYAVSPEAYERVRFKPRGWSWVDPTKEVEAYKEAIRAGFTTVTDVIAQTGNGRDLEDVLSERQEELKMIKEAGLVFDTDPVAQAELKKAETPEPSETPQPASAIEPDDETVEDAERILRRAAHGTRR